MKKITTAERLKQLMKERDLKQIDIVNLSQPFCKQYDIKIGRNDISQYLSGKVEPGQNKLFILGKALNVSEAWLMGFDVPMERNNKTREPFGAFLQKKLKESNLSIEQLSERSYIPYDTLVSYVNGKAFPNYEDFDNLSWILGFSEREMALYTDSQTFKHLIEGRYSPTGLFIRKDDTIARYDVDPLKSNYAKLNSLGRKKAAEYISDLVENSKYTQTDQEHDAEE